MVRKLPPVSSQDQAMGKLDEHIRDDVIVTRPVKCHVVTDALFC